MKNHNTYECLPVRSSIAADHAVVSGDTRKVCCAKSFSDIDEANFTTPKGVRGGVKATNFVFVLDQNKNALTPCSPARGRQMLKQGKAAVFRRFPFTIILKQNVSGNVVQPMEIRLDPGSKTTGIVVVHKKQNRVLWAAELTHRGEQIRSGLEDRRTLRKGRRARQTRYRPARFQNRTRKGRWLPPSLEHRVETTLTWVARLRRVCFVDSIGVERAKFDPQKMDQPEISGVEYQQGELQGYEIREYLLEKWGRKCVYCGRQNTPLEIDHIQPRSKGGSNRVSNLVLACHECNPKQDSDLFAGDRDSNSNGYWSYDQV